MGPTEFRQHAGGYFVHLLCLKSSACEVGFMSRPYRSVYSSVSKPPDRGPVAGRCINYTGPREVLLEFFILLF